MQSLKKDQEDEFKKRVDLEKVMEHESKTNTQSELTDEIKNRIRFGIKGIKNNK